MPSANYRLTIGTVEMGVCSSTEAFRGRRWLTLAPPLLALSLAATVRSVGHREIMVTNWR